MAKRNNIPGDNFSAQPTNNYHTPVLLKETLEGLNIKPGGIYVDCRTVVWTRCRMGVRRKDRSKQEGFCLAESNDPEGEKQPRLGMCKDSLPPEMTLPHRNAEQVENGEVSCASRGGQADREFSGCRRCGNERQEQAAKPGVNR